MGDLVHNRDALARLKDEDESCEREAKRQKKLEKALDTRVLEPWERYRALGDLCSEYIEVAELLDRKTRFALIILGAVNAINFVLLSRPDLQVTVARSWLGLYVGVDIVLSLYLFMEAIHTLKPRYHLLRGIRERSTASGGPGHLRLMADVASQSGERVFETWSCAQIGELNRELAFQVQQLARVNVTKFTALSRLFRGLLVFVLLTAGLVGTIAYQALMD